MPNVTNVTLNLQHGSGSSPSSSRNASVNFSTTFNTTEELAGVVFRADVIIRSADEVSPGGVGISIGTAIIKAVTGTISTTVSRTLTRGNLNEDPDIIWVGPPHDRHPVPVERTDEWIATVTLTPVVFSTATRNSGIVTGSWGPEGSSSDN